MTDREMIKKLLTKAKNESLKEDSKFFEQFVIGFIESHLATMEGEEDETNTN